MVLERGIVVSYETLRQWAIKFGPDYTHHLRRKALICQNILHLDEAVISINGEKTPSLSESGFFGSHRHVTEIGVGNIRAPKDMIQRLEAAYIERIGRSPAAERGSQWRP